MITLQEMNERILSLAEDVGKVKDRVADLSGENDTRKSEIRTIQRAIDDLRARVRRQGQKRTLVIKQTWALLILQVVIIVVVLVK